MPKKNYVRHATDDVLLSRMIKCEKVTDTERFGLRVMLEGCLRIRPITGVRSKLSREQRAKVERRFKELDLVSALEAEMIAQGEQALGTSDPIAVIPSAFVHPTRPPSKRLPAQPKVGMDLLFRETGEFLTISAIDEGQINTEEGKVIMLSDWRSELISIL